MKVIIEMESWFISKYDRSLKSEFFNKVIDTLSDIEVVGIEGLVDGFFR